MRVFWVLLLLAAQATRLSAQHHEAASPNPSKGPLLKQSATANSLHQAFEQGHFHGHFRTFFMATDNAPSLTDYYAWAGGGGLHFNSAPWHGLSFGMGGSFHFNLASFNLTHKDSVTGGVNRYEVGLFDVENPGNRNDLDRMEECLLRYERKNIKATLGRQMIQTPFINYQDGRMRPTAESGLYVEANLNHQIKLEGGWLWKVSPRSTVDWFTIGESIGLYPKGLNPDGTASGYPENLKSKGIGLIGLTKSFGKNTKVQGWNQWVENIFNTAFVQVDHLQPLAKDHYWVLGAQFTHQDALAYGGNENAAKTYFTKDGRSNVISTQTGWQHGKWRILGAYTHITEHGRFLSPREWGREPFYTFMPRERVEGSGGTHAFTVRTRWQTPNKNLRLEAAYGRFYLKDISQIALNKYAFPSFQQVNLDLQYHFKGTLEGLRAQVLYVWKGHLGSPIENKRYVINKVDMSHFNIILNYIY